MKPSIRFLQKVAAGEVYPYSGYSPRCGRIDRFKGGEATAIKHRDAGYVEIKYAGVLRSGSVILTDAGKSALALTKKETSP